MGTSAHLLCVTFGCFILVVLLVLKLGLFCFKTMPRTYKEAVLEPIPVGNTVSKFILLSIDCLSSKMAAFLDDKMQFV